MLCCPRNQSPLCSLIRSPTFSFCTKSYKPHMGPGAQQYAWPPESSSKPDWLPGRAPIKGITLEATPTKQTRHLQKEMNVWNISFHTPLLHWKLQSSCSSLGTAPGLPTTQTHTSTCRHPSHTLLWWAPQGTPTQLGHWQRKLKRPGPRRHDQVTWSPARNKCKFSARSHLSHLLGNSRGEALLSGKTSHTQTGVKIWAPPAETMELNYFEIC